MPKKNFFNPSNYKKTGKIENRLEFGLKFFGLTKKNYHYKKY